MNNKLILLTLLTAVASFNLLANDAITSETQQLHVNKSSASDNVINRWGRPCTPLSSELNDTIFKEYSVQSPEPIYVGGARYHLTKADFSPIYETRIFFQPCLMEPITVHLLVGYEVTFPVDGDYGQNLIFDINGRTNKSTKLKAVCGAFNGEDSGTKYIISKRQRTNGSCKTMNIELRFSPNSAPSVIDLNVAISEQI